MQIEEQIRKATFKLVRSEGWQWITFSKIAEETNLREEKVRELFPSKYAIFFSLIGDVDEIIRSEASSFQTGAVRERLFDIIMARFDALLPYKSEIKSILCHFPINPLAIMELAFKNMHSMRLMLEISNVQTSGWQGKIRIKGLMLIYVNTFRVWLNDDSPDMSKTMASLDASLRKAGSIASTLDAS